MRVVKQVASEMYGDIKTHVFPFVWHIVKWLSIAMAAIFSLGFLAYGYEKLGMSGEAGAAFATITIMGLIAAGVWIHKAYLRAKEKVKAQNKELLDTISGTTKAKPDVDDFIRRVKKQPQGNKP